MHDAINVGSFYGPCAQLFTGNRGRFKTWEISQCSACHGKNGLARDPETPNLAGLSSLYIEKALVDYKKGARHDRRMSLIAQSLTKPQMKDLAAWYSAFEVTVKVPDI